MAGDYLHNRPKVSFGTFRDFVAALPGRDKWELIDGVPIMMPPPRVAHQRIVRRLMDALNRRIEAVAPQWAADPEVGVHVPEDEDWSPEPDITVIDAEIPEDLIYAERFFMVAEVLSPSDKPAVLDKKLAYYKSHDFCIAIVFVRQDAIAITVYERKGRRWLTHVLTPGDTLTLPVLGEVASLQDIYKGTGIKG